MTSSPSAPGSAAEPRRPAIRLASIDVLRGVVILGILPMNIQLFATVDANFLNPFAGPWTDSANVTLWSVMHVLFGHKDLTIFSMLFGAGILMIDERAGADSRAAYRHYRRMLVLLGLGMLHAYLLWPGDILVTYALAGMAVYPLRRLRPHRQLFLGIAAYAVPMVLCLIVGLLLPRAPASLQESVYAMFQPSPEAMAAHHATYSQGWLAQFSDRAASSLTIQLVIVPAALFWVAAGMMLAGMALYRWGVFFAQLPVRRYLAMIALALGLGLPSILYGLHRNFAAGWDPAYSMFLGRLFSESVAPLMACGWIACWMLVCRAGALPRLTALLAAVGRMALTNYLAQTLICSFLFYGHGLGLIGRVDRFGQVGIAIAVWVLQLTASWFWLRRFQFGPAEWLWRALTYVRPPALQSTYPSDGQNEPRACSPLRAVSRAVRADFPEQMGATGSDVKLSASASSAPFSCRAREPGPPFGPATLSAGAALKRGSSFAGLLLPLTGVALLAEFAAQTLAPTIPQDLVLYLVAAGAALLVTWVCHRLFEPSERGTIGLRVRVTALPALLLGALAGAALMALWLGVVRLSADVSVTTAGSPEPAWTAVAGLAAALALAAFEEIAFRGFALRTLARWNRTGAILLCGLAFVAIHLPNPGGLSAPAMVNMFLLHLLLAAVLMRTGSLWPLIGLHAGWNYMLGTILGLPVSGNSPHAALFHTTVEPNAWTANAFGPEGGWLVTMILGMAALLAWPRRDAWQTPGKAL